MILGFPNKYLLRVAMKEMGYRDQEILVGAITTYVSTKINKSLNIIKGMVRMSIQIVCESKKTSLKDAKRLSEKERDEFFLQIMTMFFDKMNLDLGTRRKMKFDFLQIYERWKESKRMDISAIEPSIGSVPLDSPPVDAVFSNVAGTKEEGELISELDQLDLDGLDF